MSTTLLKETWWPILYIVNRVGILRNHFNLQKITYLAKVECDIPGIEYSFQKYPYGPYSPAIKTDFQRLAKLNYLRVGNSGLGWEFEITEDGRRHLETDLFPHINRKHRKEIDECIDKYAAMSTVQLQSYVYSKYIRDDVKNEFLRQNIKREIEALIPSAEALPESNNSVFVSAALNYCVSALSMSLPNDSVQKDHVLRSIYHFYSGIAETIASCAISTESFSGLELRDKMEQFDLLQEILSEYNVISRFDSEEMDLSLLLKSNATLAI